MLFNWFIVEVWEASLALADGAVFGLGGPENHVISGTCLHCDIVLRHT